MSTNDNGQKFRDAWAATFGGGGNTTEAAYLDALTTIRYNAVRGTVQAANVDSTVNSVWTATLDPNTAVKMQVTECKWTVDNAVTSVNTNVAILSLVYNNGNGGSDTTIATINTATVAGGGTGDLVAGTPVAVTINTTNMIVPANSCVAVKLTKSGAGGCATGTFSVSVKAKPSA